MRWRLRRTGFDPCPSPSPSPQPDAGPAIATVGSASSQQAGPATWFSEQPIRAAASVPANLAEGHGRCGRDRHHLWRIAYASAEEVDSHLRLLALAGAVDGGLAAVALQAFDEVRAMTWRLLNPRA